MAPDSLPRILFVPAFLGAHGGLENQVLAFARIAHAHGFAVSVLTPRPPPLGSEIGPLLEEVAQLHDAESYWRATLGGRLWRAGAYLKSGAVDRRLPRAARRSTLAEERARPFLNRFWSENGGHLLADVNLLHAFGKPKPFVVEAVRAAANLGIPTVYSEIAQVTDAYAQREDLRGFNENSNRCKRIVVYSKGQGEDVRSRFSYRGEITIIEQWADGLEDELLAIERTEAAPDAPVIVGSLSRLGPEKGLGTLLRGFAAAANVDTRLQLRVAGTGELDQTLRSLADDLGISPRVEFVGFVTDRVSFYRNVDVFTVASVEEGGPITAVEAMAAELPLLSTNCGAMPDRVRSGQEGLRFQSGDADGLAHALIEMATQPDRRMAMGRRARQRYLQHNHSLLNHERLFAMWDELSPRRAVAKN